MESKRTVGRRLQRIAVAMLCLVAAGCGAKERLPGGEALHDGAKWMPASVDSTPSRYTLAVSIYAGWMPWYYADQLGILQKWAAREGIEIELMPMEYVASIEAYVTGRADACVATNMDALGLPTAAGLETTVLIIGDYSNGNDKILTRGIASVAELKGARVLLVELSVSDYLLSRGWSDPGCRSGTCGW